ncbi:MAG: hypothetical protein HF973_12130 [Chloroflexi bacterium]|nr:hypothetical protein [Chloroflexota bacterium]
MKKLSAILLLLGAMLLLSAVLLSAAPTSFAVPWQVVGNGGGDSSNATFAVSGTIGQPVTAVSSNNNITLSSGYWSGLSANYDIYLPAIIKQ